jgi:hypothetical protein
MKSLEDRIRILEIKQELGELKTTMEKEQNEYLKNVHYPSYAGETEIQKAVRERYEKTHFEKHRNLVQTQIALKLELDKLEQ